MNASASIAYRFGVAKIGVLYIQKQIL
jgi:hypothetical protein